MSLNRTQIVDWLYRCGDIFTKESDFLTGLDKEIGDADHGLNMHRGFSKVNRGKAEPGDKTMCDVWLPVVDSLRQSSEQHLSIAAALDAACEVAERAAHATITMQARKGRASYLGERSIGHQDPGATSVLFMVQMLAAAAKE